tara:strand:+ start:495 stop:1640 length:1146 start_codon:yes stop_codon:yes gene_type:complete
MAYRQINVRSPFYVERGTTSASSTLNLRIWRGSVTSDRPSLSTYTLEKDATDGKVIFEISELVRDYIEQGDSLYALNTVWVETTVSDSGTLAPATVTTYLATEGYTIHTEGVQKSGDAFVPSYVMLPQDMYGDYRITGAEGETAYFQVMTNATNMTDWSVVRNYADGSTISSSFIPANAANSNTIIQTLGCTSEMVSIDFDLDGVQTTVHHDLFDCNKYNTPIASGLGTDQPPTYYNAELQRPVIVNYVNKYGAKNTFAFTLKHTEEITSTSQSFKRNVLNYGNLSSFNAMHSSRKVLKDSKQTFTINTDYISEYYVEQLEELILSEYVWAHIAHLSPSTYSPMPVTVIDKSISKKNHLNNKLIQYTLKIEIARDYINTIR